MHRIRDFLATRDGMLTAAVLVLALALRIAYIATHPLPPLTHDPADYQRIAASIAAGHGYPQSTVAPGGGPSAYRPPGYPYFLGAVYAVAGDHINAALVLQAFLGTITVGLIGLIALRLFGRRPALIALSLAAIYPPLVLSSSTLISETVFLPLELGSLALALHMRRAPPSRAVGVVILGVLLGLATLVRPVGILMLPPLVVALLGPRPWRSWRLAKAPVILVLATAVTLTPWLVRNVIVMHKLILTTQDGYYLGATYNSVSLHDTKVPGAVHIESAVPAYRPFVLHGHLGEVQVNDRLLSDTWSFIGAHPTYVLTALLYNTLRLFDLSGGNSQQAYENLGIGSGSADLAIYSFYVVAVLALLGLSTRTARTAPGFVWLTPILLLLLPAFVQGTSRYRLPAEPFIVILAATALASIYGHVRSRSGRDAPRVPAQVP
jgi:4-amino-4-deoxy-L-arabinose transferase-like glycosyltransferase